MLNKLKELALEENLLLGITSKTEYEKTKPLHDQYKFANSIISFAMPIEKGQDIMASYAMNRDYHFVLKEKIERIANKLNIDKYEICVDNSPIDDKLIAKLTGLGFKGKNSLIITEKGSFVMLGELLIEEELEIDSIIEKDCGSCTKCITACPVDALDNVYEKCMAGYMQRKVIIPLSIMEKFDTIYGCDICQDVCPFNKKVVKAKTYQYENIDIFDIMKCSKKEFYKYKEYAFYWLGHNVMKRNILIYAKNKGINVDDYIKYIHSKEDYMLHALEYYWRG